MEYLKLKRICQLENQIRQMVNEDNGAQCHFFYDRSQNDESANMVVLTLVTSNPRHQELFTLYSTDPQLDEVRCLDQTITYLNQIKDKVNSLLVYQVKWFKKDNPGTEQISFFYAHDIPEVIYRFYDGKDHKEFTIVSVEMRPSS